MDKIRVLYLTHDDRMQGGANRSLLTLIQSVKDVVEPIVVTARREEVFRYFTNAGIRCLTLPVPLHIQSASETFLQRIWKYPFRLVKKAWQKQLLLSGLRCEFPEPGMVDIVHSNTAVIGSGLAVAKVLRAKHIWHLREYVDLDHGLKLMGTWKSLRRAIASSDGTIAISRSVQRHFIKNPRNSDICLYNAVIPIWSEGVIPLAEKREEAFLFVGTLKESKGIEEAIRAFAWFYVKHPRWKLHVLGTGKIEYENQLRTLCRELQCEGAVSFEGFCTNTSFYYLHCRAFLMCSHMEALGRTTIEAMNYGCIPLGHNAGGTSELIESGKTGFLYHSDTELRDTMEYVGSKSCDDLRLNAHDFAQRHFTPEVYGKVIVKLYCGVLGKSLHGIENIDSNSTINESYKKEVDCQ